jgi:hypothetical protein
MRRQTNFKCRRGAEVFGELMMYWIMGDLEIRLTEQERENQLQFWPTCRGWWKMDGNMGVIVRTSPSQFPLVQ